MNSKVKTYALALDIDIDKSIRNRSLFNRTLNIQHLESFYNYRTIGSKFTLATSILSNLNRLKNLDIIKEGMKENVYAISPEIICKKTSVNFSHIHLKKKRIKAALIEYKSNKNKKKSIVSIDFEASNASDSDNSIFEIPNNSKSDLHINKNNNKSLTNEETNLLNFFTITLEPVEQDNSVKQKPIYCRGELETSNTKKSCMECDTVCAYTMEDILSENRGIGQKDIIKELINHHHPSSRRILHTNKLRDTKQAARELADHYIYRHNYKEPQFL